MHYLLRNTSGSLFCSAILITALASCGGGGGSSDPDPTPDPGGDTTTYSIGGTITGNDQSVTLSLNGISETFTSSPFTFTNKVEDNGLFTVQFVSTPNNQVCTISNGNGTITADIFNIGVVCTAVTDVLIYDDAEIIGGMTSGDFNGDNIIDLAFVIRTMTSHTLGYNNDMMRFAFGAGNGSFPSTYDVATFDRLSRHKRGHAVLSGDFNNDGIDDLANYSGRLEIFSGNASNTPQDYAVIDTLTSSAFYTLDIDGNGDLDIITFTEYMNWTGGLFFAYRNNGDGTFTAAENFPAAATDPTEFNRLVNIHLNDFDGDGDKDILAYGQTYDTVNGKTHALLGLFTNNGDGTFSAPASYHALSDDMNVNEVFLSIDSKNIASGDFDGDGDIDVAITSNTSFLQVLINDGSGQFTAGQRVVVGTTPIHVRAADFDNDGTLDLVSLNDTSRNAIISYGNGDGTFGDNTGSADSWLTIQIEGDVDLYDMDLGDIDLDGYLDIMIAEFSPNATTNGHGSIRLIRSPGK